MSTNLNTEPGLQRPSLPQATERTLANAIRNIYDNLFFLKNKASAPVAAPQAAVSTSHTFTRTGPPSSTTSWRITHNLNTESVIVQIQDFTTGIIIGPAGSPSATVVNPNVVQIDATSAMDASSITVIILS